VFIAHLPAGYLVTRGLQRLKKMPVYLGIGLIASVLPDIDLLYFYTFGHRQVVHHDYFTHLPLFWVSAWLVCYVYAKMSGQLKTQFLVLVFFTNIFLHLILDTFVGGINWLYPFSRQSIELITLSNTHDFWVLNFVLSRSFLVEILIALVALGYWVYEKRTINNTIITSAIEH